MFTTIVVVAVLALIAIGASILNLLTRVSEDEYDEEWNNGDNN